ncbi:MAG TPA: argininosuccinate lyase [Saprospiraceae bacterium]|nr:argininosuccinate lyase [Saprospiraceae bacterium]HMQ83291.1 argininosuccinate lyase [Saprospiraceae bacterium]
MKLWDKGYTIHNLVERYTVGKDRELDLKLAPYDIQGNIAQAKMLHHIGILDDRELADLLRALSELADEVEQGRFIIEAEFEDVHSKIEFELVKRVGEAGKKIHTARSRNDQVLVDLHLYAKAEIQALKGLMGQLFDTLIDLSDKHKAVLMPGYTHLQIAMPSSFGLWFGAYAESLVDDMILLQAAYQISDQNPLGSAAGYGTSFPINRQMTTDLLGFSTMKYNVVAAQMSRGKLEKTLAYALAAIGATLSKLSMDVCLYMSQNFNFIRFPKELTTGSSIMPHKQNPDVFELMRAKCNKIQQLPAEITLLINNLPSGYHRDFQMLKESLMEAIDGMKDNLAVCDFMLQHIEVNAHILEQPLYDHLYTVEEVNRLVMEGKPFREAYQMVGQQLAEGRFVPPKALVHTHEGSIGNLCLAEISAKMQALRL